eukprot:11325440-Karenia_brevis.AAC.1
MEQIFRKAQGCLVERSFPDNTAHNFVEYMIWLKPRRAMRDWASLLMTGSLQPSTTTTWPDGQG